MQLIIEKGPNGLLTTLKYDQQKISEEIGNVTENVTENVTKNRLTQIVELIKENPKITTLEIANQLSLTKRTILRDIEKLK